MNTKKYFAALLFLSITFIPKWVNAADMPVRCQLDSWVYSYVSDGQEVVTNIVDAQQKSINTFYSNWILRRSGEFLDGIELSVITACMRSSEPSGGIIAFPGISILIKDPISEILSSSYSSFWESEQKVRVTFLKRNQPLVVPNEIKREYYRKIECSWEGRAAESDCQFGSDSKTSTTWSVGN